MPEHPFGLYLADETEATVDDVRAWAKNNGCELICADDMFPDVKRPTTDDQQ